MEKKLNLLFIWHHSRNAIRGASIAKALAGKGHQLTCVHTAPQAVLHTEVTESDGIRWVSVPDLLRGRARTGWDPWSTYRRIAYLKLDNSSYDLIHCFETRPATIYPAKYYRKKHAIPLFTDWNDWWGRGGIIDNFRPRWYRMLFGRLETYYEEAFRTEAVGTTVISTALGRRAELLGVPPDRICYLPGGTFPDYFINRDKEICRAKVGLPLHDPLIAFSSWQTHWDLDVVMKTLAIVSRKYDRIKLMVTGKSSPRVRELAEKYGVEDRLIITGYLPKEELPWYLGCADLFVLPFPETIYNVGRWPNKLGDYIALGRPTVSNPVGDVLTFFEKHEVGLLAGFDERDFADKVIQLLDDSALRERLSNNARQVALMYDYPTLVTGLEEFYWRILGD